MIVLAITGGIGSGKTAVRNWFQSQNIPTLDADLIGKQLVAKNQHGLNKIVETFGNEFLLDTGELNRDKMRKLVFNNPQKKQQLEGIMHPLIRQRTNKLLEQLNQQQHPLAVVEIPLLTETGKPDYVDKVLVTDCQETTQIKRTQQRSGLNQKEIQSIINQQASRSERKAIANFVIDTEQPQEAMKQKLHQILDELIAS